MNFIGKKVSVAETNTLLIDRSELKDGIVIDQDECGELLRTEFTFRGLRREFAMLPEELIFEEE